MALRAHVGPLPDRLSLNAPDHLDPRRTEAFDLADPGFHPFNEATLVFLLDELKGGFDRASKKIEELTPKQLREEDRIQLNRCADFVAEASRRFDVLRRALQPFTKDFDMQAATPYLSELAALNALTVVAHRAPDSDGNTVVSFHDMLRSTKDDARMTSWYGYLECLYRHALYMYTEEPSCLPPAQRARFEADWGVEAAHESGAMGHAPLGHLYTPYGPGTPNEVLLELRSSDMVGWIWGDVYSIVFFIDREDLAAGRFDKVTCAITN